MNTDFVDVLLSGVRGARRYALVRFLVAGGLFVVLSFMLALARKTAWFGGPRATAPAVGQVFAEGHRLRLVIERDTAMNRTEQKVPER